MFDMKIENFLYFYNCLVLFVNIVKKNSHILSQFSRKTINDKILGTYLNHFAINISESFCVSANYYTIILEFIFYRNVIWVFYYR